MTATAAEKREQSQRSFRLSFLDVQVEIISLDTPDSERPPAVFAVPTFLLNGELLWLGNPHREDAIQQIADLLQGTHDA